MQISFPIDLYLNLETLFICVVCSSSAPEKRDAPASIFSLYPADKEAETTDGTPCGHLMGVKVKTSLHFFVHVLVCFEHIIVLY